MKIRIEIDENAHEDEVIIRCKELNENVKKVQQAIKQYSVKTNLVFMKENTEYFIPLSCVLFFETAEKGIEAHTADDLYTIKNKLYELEKILPANFVRASKSSILNIDHIYSIEKNITSASLVRFNGSHKQLYVSRNYYKALKQRLNERRNYET